jgi:hypothetical protein
MNRQREIDFRLENGRGMGQLLNKCKIETDTIKMCVLPNRHCKNRLKSTRLHTRIVQNSSSYMVLER